MANLLKGILNIPKETIALGKDLKAISLNNKQTKKNIKQIAIDTAKNNYRNTTGKEMTPSLLKSYYDGVVSFPWSKTDQAISNYEKDKKRVERSWNKKLGG